MDRLTHSNFAVNVEKTRELQGNPKWVEYKKWLLDNNCKFPSVIFI